jgi:hypothetical protein
MPRFYFDVVDGSAVTADQEGLEFDNIEGAEQEALQAALEMCRWRAEHNYDLRIKIRDANRQSVVTVTVSTQVERHTPQE